MIDTIRVGWFLATRRLTRSGLGTSGLIVFIMMLTFLNLVVISGILVGLIEGSKTAFGDEHTGNVLLTNYTNDEAIEHSNFVLDSIYAIPEVEAASARYVQGGIIENKYRERAGTTETIESIAVVIGGFNPIDEEHVTHFSKLISEGEMLNEGDEGEILISKFLLKRYVEEFGSTYANISDVFPGDKIRIVIGDVKKEFKVKGVFDPRVDPMVFRVYMLDTELKKLLQRDSYGVNEIAVRIDETKATPERVKQTLIALGILENALIQTAEETLGKFIDDIQDTFDQLGIMIGGIGIIVASITIFIVIYINAITRRRYIGILKGIGIRESAIEFSYIVQSMIYAFVGSALGMMLVYWILVPYFLANPIKFPFSDGILVVPLDSSLTRVGLLLVTTFVAGYLPARKVIKQNTLDSILGR